MKRRSAEKPLLGSSTSMHLIGELSSGMGFPNGDFLCVYFVFTMCLLCVYYVFTMYLLCIYYVFTMYFLCCSIAIALGRPA